MGIRAPSPLEKVQKTVKEKNSSVSEVDYQGNHPTYLLVQHIGISATGFKCFIDNCQFPEEPDEDQFRNHLSKHKSTVWSCICTACNDSVGTSYNRSVCDEFEHLLISHDNVDSLKDSGSPALAEEQVVQEHIETIVLDSDGEKDFVDVCPKSPSQELRPWIQGDVTANKAELILKKKPETLEALFKCMGNDCLFTAFEEKYFAEHLKLHREQLDTSYHRCAYCSFKDDDGNALTNHIQTVHGYDRYRCDLVRIKMKCRSLIDS